MLEEKNAVVRRAMILLDGVIVTLSFLLAYSLRENFHIFYKLDIIPSMQVVADSSMSMNDYLVVIFFVVPLWCISLYYNGMYRTIRTKVFSELFWIILESALLTALISSAAVFLLKLKFVSRIFFFIFMVASSGVLLLEKAILFFIVRHVRRYGYNYRRLLIVGTGSRAVNFVDKIRKHPEWGLRIKGVIDDEPSRVGKEVKELDIIGALDDLADILHKRPIDEVVFIVPRSRLDEIQNALYACETEGVKATIAVDFFELKMAKSRQTELDGIPLITFETTLAQEWQLFVKRTLDIIISALSIVLLSPLLLLTALIVKITSDGPVVFSQKRIGLNGRRFVLLKFRTMYKGSHEKLSEMEHLNELGGPVFKMRDDPRITHVGKILRKFSIDELPQLFNVFVGHMSLVGPRPPLPREFVKYKPWQRRRLSMRPGLTCLWQVSGRNKLSFEEWMKLDLEYLDNWSLQLDFKILLKTVPTVLLGIGAQ